MYRVFIINEKNRLKNVKPIKKKVSPGFEPGSLDSKSKVLTITPRNQNCIGQLLHSLLDSNQETDILLEYPLYHLS